MLIMNKGWITRKNYRYNLLLNTVKTVYWIINEKLFIFWTKLRLFLKFIKNLSRFCVTQHNINIIFIFNEVF